MDPARNGVCGAISPAEVLGVTETNKMHRIPQGHRFRRGGEKLETPLNRVQEALLRTVDAFSAA